MCGKWLRMVQQKPNYPWRTVGSSLVNIMKSGNIQAREAALKALNQISSREASAKVLVGLTNSPTTVLNVVSAIKSSGATISLVQFVEAPQKDLRVASIKLLQNLYRFLSGIS
ncbi:hypothetical protein EZV62_001156 [Acer yangbiense]|uniref:Uncharacterized protein n=1 Tax=Acer yangbiense TaxID=1000413 RepID=A0A5C7ITA8_9ROSI|nr:hypothetical protein EZV62_001156 [Acer yangbiense]